MKRFAAFAVALAVASALPAQQSARPEFTGAYDSSPSTQEPGSPPRYRVIVDRIPGTSTWTADWYDSTSGELHYHGEVSPGPGGTWIEHYDPDRGRSCEDYEWRADAKGRPVSVIRGGDTWPLSRVASD